MSTVAPTSPATTEPDRYPTRTDRPGIFERRDPVVYGEHPGPLTGSQVASFDHDGFVVVDRLIAEGARVRAWDPVALEDARPLLRGAELVESVEDALRDADAVVLVTAWKELRALTTPENAALMRNPLLVDGRNMLDPDAARAAGFAYEGIGRASSVLRAVGQADVPEPDLQA